MKFYLKMPVRLFPCYKNELQEYRRALNDRNFHKAWYHLERAHIIGQAYPVPHSNVHWHMLMFGVRIKSIREVIGQIPRLLAGGVKSFVGRIPVGNTGGADVPPLRRMPIPEEIRRMFQDAGVG